MSEAEFTKEFLKKLVEKNSTNQSAIIHRDMCSKNSEKTRNQNRELYDICANK